MRFLLTPLLASVAIATTISAQTITVRLLDGKTGQPIANKNITFHWSSDDSVAGTVVRIGNDGKGQIRVPKGATTLYLMGGPKDGKEPYRVAYLNCNAPSVGHDGKSVPVSEVFRQGVVPENTCSKRTQAAQPGVIVFWAQTLPWYQPDMQ